MRSEDDADANQYILPIPPILLYSKTLKQHSKNSATNEDIIKSASNNFKSIFLTGRGLSADHSTGASASSASLSFSNFFCVTGVSLRAATNTPLIAMA
jgi:hypothetical protein